MSLHELLGALRSYMANVTGRKSWSPIHDHLHYALIEGHDGERRWHLVHPDALPHLDTLGLPYTLHDELGGEVRDGGDMTGVTSNFHANRVPSIIAEHPQYGPVVVKGREGHGDLRTASDVSESARTLLPVQRNSPPPRSLRWSEKPDHHAPSGGNGQLNLHSDLQPYEEVIRDRMNMKPLTRTEVAGVAGIEDRVYRKRSRTPESRTPITPLSDQINHAENGEDEFGRNAEWFTQAARVSGAPVVPLYQGRIGALADEANDTAAENSRHESWYKHPDQYASFQAYVAPPAEAGRGIKVPVVPGHMTEQYLAPEHDDWINRLQGRLDSSQEIAGAPDCHSGNVIDVPGLFPGKQAEHPLVIAPVEHGIDYEWVARDGILGDSDYYAREIARQLEDFEPESEAARNHGILDTVGTMSQWPDPAQHDFHSASYLLDNIREAWGEDHDPFTSGQSSDDDLNKVMVAARKSHISADARDPQKGEVRE